MNNLGSISQKILRWKGLYFESKALYTPKLNTFIDKYKVIKVACVAGTSTYTLNKSSTYTSSMMLS